MPKEDNDFEYSYCCGKFLTNPELPPIVDATGYIIKRRYSRKKICSRCKKTISEQKREVKQNANNIDKRKL